jgi:hypothetical protein
MTLVPYTPLQQKLTKQVRSYVRQGRMAVSYDYVFSEVFGKNLTALDGMTSA